VSKGVAITWLARRAGVPLSRTLAIGDQWNDLEMLRTAGHSAAMPSAPAEVRAAARYLAPPVTEQGAAAIIEALVLASPRDAAASARRLAAEARAATDRGRSIDRPAPTADVA
jgi:3-deoxy-D-manno-octulosonate 8-phosphate phosphatase KdsC-like HAD superfamily phosphatase